MSRPKIIDGGLATELEAAGHALHPRLWSAGVFLNNPAAVEQVHARYLHAGAEILISASYQMAFDNLARAGLDREQAARTMRATVDTARDACRRTGRKALVAASVGPYGATLCDGSEYRGDYGIDESDLFEFHRERLEVLATSGADLLAVETVPSILEARALARLLALPGDLSAWVSFSCRDGSRLRDGSPLAEAARLFDGLPRLRAVGINCTDPEPVAELIELLRAATSKPVVVYPNSGERWDARTRAWTGRFDADAFCDLAAGWAGQGVWALGGCCRVDPDLIARIAGRLAA